jgi:hypothetical protein
MTENELRELAHLVKKYRHAFAWNLGKDRDKTGKVSDAMLKSIRQIIRDGGTYHDRDFIVKGGIYDQTHDRKI